MTTLLNFVVGVATGVISGWGVGGGTLLMVYMTAFVKMSPIQARNINLIYFLPTSVVALVSHIKNGFVKWCCAIPAAGAGISSAIGGALLASYIHTDIMKKVFGAFLIIVGIEELIKSKKVT